ncbi:hypothetical protein PYCCODRAFT_1463966 [Trametes coccinea BRFM310]|uniref:Transmembrane protein n=1 Tax=Trametes coccinea (strain BRFM310) TaxID=1353009 RepID=A0A1Y2J0A8_TRAC3|nr:hypothetical protein PYCCODRAFT_1463966 [Trametes coccinea BRFM310]
MSGSVPPSTRSPSEGSCGHSGSPYPRRSHTLTMASSGSSAPPPVAGDPTSAAPSKLEFSEPIPRATPTLPTHNRVVSDATLNAVDEMSPNRFEDALSAMQSTSLPYSGPQLTQDEKSDYQKSPNLVQSAEPEPIEPEGKWAKMWFKLMYKYDIWYYYLKQRWPLVCALVLTIVVCLSVAIGWCFRLKTFNIADPDSFHNAVVQLSANIVDVDPNAQEITLDWGIEYECEVIGCPDVNIYFDSNTLRSDSGSSQVPSNVKPDPIFAVNGGNVRAMRNNTDRRPSALTFRTEVAITNAPTHRTLQSYPYDKYVTKLVFFAEEAATNESVSIAIVKTTGIAVGFNVQLQNITEIRDNFETVTKNIEVTRGPVVRLYALFIVLIVWLVTLTFMATCVMNVFFGKGISSGVLVLPVGTLFAFTQLRATLPGAPEGFGAVIDFVGILPCLAILTFCSVLMTAVFLLRDPERDIPRWQWKEPGEGRKSVYRV